MPTANAFSITITLSRSRERLPDLLERVGPEAPDTEGGDVDPFGSQLVDDLVDRPEHRAERDDDRLGVSARVRAQQAAGGPAERLRELARDPRHEVERLHLLRVHQVLDLGERLGADHGTDRHRVVRVEHLSRLEGGQERVDLSLRREGRRARPRG